MNAIHKFASNFGIVTITALGVIAFGLASYSPNHSSGATVSARPPLAPAFFPLVYRYYWRR